MVVYRLMREWNTLVALTSVKSGAHLAPQAMLILSATLTGKRQPCPPQEVARRINNEPSEDEQTGIGAGELWDLCRVNRKRHRVAPDRGRGLERHYGSNPFTAERFGRSISAAPCARG